MLEVGVMPPSSSLTSTVVRRGLQMAALVVNSVYLRETASESHLDDTTSCPQGCPLDERVVENQ
jgi:hypothetical protein